jgi:hypothetical protein
MLSGNAIKEMRKNIMDEADELKEEAQTLQNESIFLIALISKRGILEEFLLEIEPFARLLKEFEETNEDTRKTILRKQMRELEERLRNGKNKEIMKDYFEYIKKTDAIAVKNAEQIDKLKEKIEQTDISTIEKEQWVQEFTRRIMRLDPETGTPMSFKELRESYSDYCKKNTTVIRKRRLGK